MDEGLRAYMLKVYNYMASGILINRYSISINSILKCLVVTVFGWIYQLGVNAGLSWKCAIYGSGH